LRIEVNNEWGVYNKFYPQAVEVLKSGGGRWAVITFSFLEDRIVETLFQKTR
jgi:16S rRNA C1402 N4-methylase RsmH